MWPKVHIPWVGYSEGRSPVYHRINTATDTLTATPLFCFCLEKPQQCSDYAELHNSIFKSGFTSLHPRCWTCEPVFLVSGRTSPFQRTFQLTIWIIAGNMNLHISHVQTTQTSFYQSKTSNLQHQQMLHQWWHSSAPELYRLHQSVLV